MKMTLQKQNHNKEHSINYFLFNYKDQNIKIKEALMKEKDQAS